MWVAPPEATLWGHRGQTPRSGKLPADGRPGPVATPPATLDAREPGDQMRPRGSAPSQGPWSNQQHVLAQRTGIWQLKKLDPFPMCPPWGSPHSAARGLASEFARPGPAGVVAASGGTRPNSVEIWGWTRQCGQRQAPCGSR